MNKHPVNVFFTEQTNDTFSIYWYQGGKGRESDVKVREKRSGCNVKVKNGVRYGWVRLCLGSSERRLASGFILLPTHATTKALDHSASVNSALF